MSKNLTDGKKENQTQQTYKNTINKYKIILKVILNWWSDAHNQTNMFGVYIIIHHNLPSMLITAGW